MTRKRTDESYRRNRLAMSICYHIMQMTDKDAKCSCYNGDEYPDQVHFEHCRCMLKAADEALKSKRLAEQAA